MPSAASLVVSSGYIERGKLVLRNRGAWNESIAQFKDGTEVEVTISLLRATRSIQANRFYWGVVVKALCDHTGYEPDEIHHILKAKFLPKPLAVTDGNGRIVDAFVIGGSTREMSVEQFADYTKRIQEWAADQLHIVIPDPDEDHHAS